MRAKAILLLATAAVICTLSLLQIDAEAQCSMCRAVAESGQKDDASRVARGLNNGILYLLAMPYILGGVAYFIWRRNRRQA